MCTVYFYEADNLQARADALVALTTYFLVGNYSNCYADVSVLRRDCRRSRMERTTVKSTYRRLRVDSCGALHENLDDLLLSRQRRNMQRRVSFLEQDKQSGVTCC